MSIRTIVAALAMTTIASTAGAVAVVNGGFEDPAGTGSFNTYAAGSTALTGWAISGASIDHITGYWQNSEGRRSIDMQGNSGNATITQSVSGFTVGQSYMLMFDMAGNPAGNPAVKKLIASIGGTSGSYFFDKTGKTLSDMGWETMTLSFVAGATTLSLAFTADNSGTSYGPALDNVRIVDAPAVPLPAAGLLLVGALGGLGLMRRKG